MAKMRDFLMDVEELYEAGLSMEQIAERLGVDLSVVLSALKWLGQQPEQPSE